MQINKIVLSVKDLDESIKFYENAFNFELLKKTETGIGQNALLKCGGLLLTLIVSPKLPIGIVSLGCDTDEDINKTYEELISKGAKPVMEPQKLGLGCMAKCFDPNDISIEIMSMDLSSEDSGMRLTHLPNKLK